MSQKFRNLILLLSVVLALFGRAFASTTMTITIGGQEIQISGTSVWDTGQITLVLTDSNGQSYPETVSYGQYSTPACIASTFGAKFTNDYFTQYGLCAYASGATITFHLKGTATLNSPSITDPSVSFSVAPNVVITGILPNPSAVGSTVTIYGGPFGASQGSSQVVFYHQAEVCSVMNPGCRAVAGTPSSWSDSAIVVQVPAGVSTGDVEVIVNGNSSSGFLLMLSTSTCP